MTRSSLFTAMSAALAVSAVTVVIAKKPLAPGTAPGTFVGPTSSQTPYVVPTSAGWEATSLITVGDSPDGQTYRMAGLPDGLGALSGRATAWGSYEESDRYLTVFMNHEIGASAGAVRAHGQTGAFVSEWRLRLDTLEIESGRDLVQSVYLWDYATSSYVFANGQTAAQFGRLCSADLPAMAAFYNPATGKGYPERIFMNGEESGSEGRAFAHIASGPEKGASYQLPYLGRFSWENSVAHPGAGDKTLVVGLDDSTPGQVYLYVGDKRQHGNAVEQAGLQGGTLWGIRVTNGGANYAGGAVPLESHGAINGTFALVDVSDVATGTGVNLQTQSVARGITEFARPEDGAWDTLQPNVFYFVTTGATIGSPTPQTQSARLYKLTLNSLVNPTGGTIDLVLDAASLTGTDGQTARSFDNIGMDAAGRVLIQEDPGNTGYIAKTWRVNPNAADVLAEAEQVLESDRVRFAAPATLTQDEENSGVIEITDMVKKASWAKQDRRYYLGVSQSHRPLPSPLVEDGQLYLFSSRKLK